MWRTAAAGACAFFFAGCINVGRTPNFEQPIAAEPLREIAAPAGDATPAPLAALLPTISPEVIAARTDIKGAGDKSMKIESVEVTGKDPIKHRVADYSSEQTASMICLADKIGFRQERARKAHDATLRAHDLRAKAARGEASWKEADKAELQRQSAVIDSIGLSLFGFSIGARDVNDLPDPLYRGVVIEDADLFTFKENGKAVMAVSGMVRNASDKAVELPPVTLEALDRWRLQLAGQTSLLDTDALAPGESRPFELRFKNPPETTAEVYVHFAPPFIYRNPRDCDFFDPATFDAAASSASAAATAAAETAASGDYTASELNLLTQWFRREAEKAWRCREAGKRCLWAPRALGWRDMFAISEASDEAWIATRAAVEARRPSPGVSPGAAATSAAEAAHKDSLERIRIMGERALARAGGSAPGVVVELVASTVGKDDNGSFVEIVGTARNTSDAPRTLEALMLAAVDRLDLPLASVAIDFPRTLAPGESVEFSQHVPIRIAGAIDAGLGGGANPATLLHVPGKDIPWQVRLGAMGR